MNRMRVMAVLMAASVAAAPLAEVLAIPAYADEIETSIDMNENSGASTTTSSDDDEAEDGEDVVYQNGSIATKDTSTYEAVSIKTVEDLRTLARNCRSDAWSRDKRVTLEADLALSGDDASIEIATFGGIFNGNGHTISGLIVNDDAADRGLFGTIQESGLVQDLTVAGALTPSGTQSRIGGIAGTNYGQISGCTFQGTIEADAELGGIAGRNKLSGIITNCMSRGTITGNSYTGGIVGYNEGEVATCNSRMDVNIDYTDTTASVDQLSNTISNILMTGEINSTENITARTDTGGIAGFSSGILTSCKNTGSIGYEHVGYNTGGIVGRSSGFVNGCNNYGKVLGRKDVGGIAGQLTPNLRLDFEEGTLDEISDGLDNLDALVNRTLDNTQSYSNDTSDRLNRISDLTGSAKDSTKIITDNAQNRVDEAVPKINDATSTMQSAMSTLSGVTGDVSSYSDRIVDSMDEIDDAVDDLLDDLNLTDSEKERIRTLVQNINSDIDGIRSALKDITDIVAKGSDEIAQNAERIQKDVDAIVDYANDIYDNCEELQDILEQHNAWDNFSAKDEVRDLMNDTKLIAETAQTLGEYVTRIQNKDSTLGKEITDILGDWSQDDEDEYIGMVEKAEKVSSAIDAYIENNKDSLTEEERQELTEISQGLKDETIGINDALDSIQRITDGSIADSEEALKEFSAALRKLEKYQSGLLGNMQTGNKLLKDLANHYGSIDWDDLSSSLDGLSDVLNDAPDISSRIQSSLDSLASLDLHVDGISDSTRTAGDDLYSSMSSLLEEMDALNSTINSDANATYDDLRAISSQISDIGDLFNDAVNGITDDDDDDHIEDVSAEDIDGSTRGRLTGCLNTGTIEADNNVGGVVGTMGLEYDLDPEKDIQKVGDSSFEYSYRVKCIVDRSENQGKVEIANNYGGGVVGHMEMGVASACEDYGTVEGEGSYTGGIAGYSVGTVQRCYAKADISGGKYVGGIAGYAETLYDNAAMVNITDAEQYIGAIAGRVKELDQSKVSGNTYVSTEVWGIDGISYEGIAEGITYESLLAKSDIPADFDTIQLVFSVDDTFVAEIDCNYGDSIPEDEIPEVPVRDGFHGEWSRTDYTNITADEAIEAVYSRINTLLSGEQQRESGKPVVLVSGDFAEDDAIRVAADADNTEDKETWSVSIPDDGLETHEIRYLPLSEDPESVTIYVVQDGHRQRVDTSEMGKYVTFKAAGNDVTFIAQTESNAGRIRRYAALGGCAAAAIAALAAGHAGLKKARRKKRAENRRKKH